MANRKQVVVPKDRPFVIEVLQAQEEYSGKPVGLWIGHSRFQCPSFVLDYAGGSPARVVLSLYDRAQGHSYSSKHIGTLTFKVRAETLAERTGLTVAQVYRSQVILERDNRLYRRQPLSKASRTFLGNEVTLLLPQRTKQGQLVNNPISTAPKKPGLLSENGMRDYIVIPQDTLPAIKQVSRHGLAVLLAAMEAITKAGTGTESARITKPELRHISGLGLVAFRKGFRECLSQKLLAFSDNVLTVHDPHKRRPTQRWRNRRAELFHQRKKFAFDLNERTADDYRSLLTKVLNTDCSDIPEDDWHRIWPCPLCLNEQNGKITKRPTFAVHIEPSVAGFHCYLCGAKGKLIQLAAQVLGISTSDAIEYFRLLLNPPVQEPEEVAVQI
jgi:hypothetical protein